MLGAGISPGTGTVGYGARTTTEYPEQNDPVTALIRAIDWATIGDRQGGRGRSVTAIFVEIRNIAEHFPHS